MSKAVLCVGGAGFIGSHLTKRLLDDGHSVAILDHAPGKSPFYMHPEVRIINADVITPGAVMSAIEDFDAVFHLAGHVDVRASVKYPYEDAENNIMGAVNVLDACTEHGKPVVYTSSASVYGNAEKLPLTEDMNTMPVSPYGLSKLTAEKYFTLYNRLYDSKTISLRLLNVAGPLKFKGAFYNFAKAFANHEPVNIYGSGIQSRDFIPVGDVVDALMKAMNSEKWGEVYNIGTNKATTVSKLVSMFRDASKSDSQIQHLSPNKGEVKRSYADISKAKKELGWEPKIPLKSEIKRIMEWAEAGLTVDAWRELNLESWTSFNEV